MIYTQSMSNATNTHTALTTIAFTGLVDERSEITGTWAGAAADVAELVQNSMGDRGLTCDSDEVEVDEDGTWSIPAYTD